MSEVRRTWRDRRRGKGVDSGMTLPELLISIVVTGTLVSGMAVATTVVLRQGDNNKGRLNNSRSEQSVGLWMPADLASAEYVDTNPASTPCGTACPTDVNVGGSNAVQLEWTGSAVSTTTGQAVATTTKVSYRYVEVADGFDVIRVACVSVGGAAPTCDQLTLLHNVEAPPVGVAWTPGVTQPTWVMLVGLALDPASPDAGSGAATSSDPTYRIKNGRRVTVTVNGGGDIAGAGGGEDKITLSAGGVDRQTNLSTSNLNVAPTFSATRSRCGGNFGMLVDTSGSIGSTNMSSVRTGITQFVNTFAGTPIKLQVVRFSSTASTLGAGTGWSRWYDMLVDADVTDLKNQVATLSSSGSTNYEDALFRMFMNSDGTTQQVLPDTLIFFTDGMPTYNRLNATSASAAAVAHPDDSGFPSANGSSYNQLSWNRANRIARQYDADVERFIGVYVGSDTTGTSTWSTQGAGYHLENYLRGYRVMYERGYHAGGYLRGYHLNYERAGSGLIYEEKKGTSWSSMSRSNYENKNISPGEADGYRARVSGTLSSWTSTTQALYDASNTTADSLDGFRTSVSYTSPYSAWEATTSSLYASNNTTADNTDGWDVTKAYSAPFDSWEETTQAIYNSGNTTSDATDGYRSSNSYTSPYSLWETSTEAAYTAGNTTWGNSDGWDATKVYTTPYTFHESITNTSVMNTEILSRIVTVGSPVPASPTGGPYTNAAVADMYVLPNWSQFADAINSVALAECGGTVTLQTRIGSSAASDPFTYQNSKDLTIATTSQQYRSGTFDFDLPGGQPISVDITPVNLSNLNRYSPVSWSCKANGVNYPFTQTQLSGSQWSKITLTVSPNQAISCIQTVKLN